MRTLTLSRDQLREMIVHAAAHAPAEACGLLAGRAGRVERVIGVPNQEASPVRYRMEPAAQLRAFEAIDREQLDLLGIFHSHPAGPATPSATDVQEAAYAVVQVVLSRRGAAWSARGFWIGGGGYDEVELRIE